MDPLGPLGGGGHARGRGIPPLEQQKRSWLLVDPPLWDLLYGTLWDSPLREPHSYPTPNKAMFGVGQGTTRELSLYLSRHASMATSVNKKCIF